MNTSSEANYQLAIRDFHEAHRQATLRDLISRLTGRSSDLLNYNQVLEQLKRTENPIERGVQEIPLDQIVGSVGRYRDFTRDFLPKRASDESRWANVKAAVHNMTGMSPIEVYQIGDAYFVRDGNHRVSVARQLGSKTISAHVTEIKTRVPLTASDDAEQLITKARYVHFLELTDMDKICPGANLVMTVCGQYEYLLNQIQAQCALLSGDQAGRCDPQVWPQAIRTWYWDVYMPVVSIIRELGIMSRFPDKTETDIYVLISSRRDSLEEALGWHLEPEDVVTEMLEEEHQRPPILERFVDALAPELDQGPHTGMWRRHQIALHREDRLFADILVLLEGIPEDARLLEQVIRIAQWDQDRILGLYVVQEESQRESPQVQALREAFERRCQQAGLVGEFAVEVGKTSDRIIERASWADLVVINLTYEPETELQSRLQSGWGRLLRRCPRPILVIPNAVGSEMRRALLAYDGSPKAREALYVSTYLAARWQLELTVMTVLTSKTGPGVLDEARQYLEERGVGKANYLLRGGDAAEAILASAEAAQSDWIIMGGISRRSILQLRLGSTVEHILQQFEQPVLICR